MEKMPSQNTPVWGLKVATLPVDLPCSGFVPHSWDILITGKSYKKKPNRSIEETSGCVRQEWVKKWPATLTAT
jgi:hypothetical protein